MSQKEQTPERHRTVRQYLKQYSNCSKTSIARLLVEEHPLLFKDAEQARGVIRYISGNHGNKCRKHIKDKSMVKETKANNIYGLLPNEHNDITPYRLPKTAKKVGIISDVHIPYHDIEAVTLALDWLKEREIDTLILNGDIIDFYQASFFDKDPTVNDLKYELDAAREFLKQLRSQFQQTDIIYLEGNHEFRWKRYLMRKAPEIFNMGEFNINIILGLPELNIKWIDNKRIIQAGKLNILHGHEYYGAYSPVNPAKGIFNKAKNNVIFGHFHRTSSHTSKDIRQDLSGAWSTGCLCELQPKYAPYNEWNLGFAMVKLEQNGNFRVINKMIIDGEID